MRLRVFDSPSNFLDNTICRNGHVPEVVLPDVADSNMALGVAYDAVSKGITNAGHWISVESNEGEVDKKIVLAIASSNSQMFFLTSPLRNSISFEELKEAIQIAASHLAAVLPSPTTVQSLMGPRLLTQAFMDAWMDIHARPPDLRPRSEAFLTTSLAVLTGQPVGPPPTLPHGCMVQRITSADVDAPWMNDLIHCIVDFFGDAHGTGSSQEAARSLVQTAASSDQSLLWVYLIANPDPDSASPSVAGYCYLGRQTPSTVAIRHVYTAPTFRRRGVAEVLVSTAARGWLTGPSAKSEICLFVAPWNPEATRVYERCGFVVRPELWEDVGWEGVERGQFG